MLEDYFLLVRRIQGIGLSLDDYWEMDTWSTAKLLYMEKEIIKSEQEEYNDQKNTYKERHEDNSDEMNDIMDRLQG